MGSTNHDLGTFCCLSDFHDVSLQSGIGFWSLKRNLLSLGQKSFHATKIKKCVARICLLNHACDYVTFTPCIFFIFKISFNFANSLCHYLSSCLGSNSSEILRSYIELLSCRFTILIDILCKNSKLHTVRIYCDPRKFMCSRHSLICRLQCVCQCCKHVFDSYPFIRCNSLQSFQHFGIHCSILPSIIFSFSPKDLNDSDSGCQTKTVLAFCIIS